MTSLVILVFCTFLGFALRFFFFFADMHSVMEGEDGVEPHDVFVDLGVLIVEGRIPGGAWTAGRGYGEGPHCVGVGISSLPARHDCDPNNNFLVSKRVGIIA